MDLVFTDDDFDIDSVDIIKNINILDHNLLIVDIDINLDNNEEEERKFVYYSNS